MIQTEPEDVFRSMMQLRADAMNRSELESGWLGVVLCYGDSATRIGLEIVCAVERRRSCGND